MPKRPNPYGAAYQRARKQLLHNRPWCELRYEGCTGRATTADHQPPLSDFPPGEWRGQLVPSCASCNYRSGGWRLVNSRNGYGRPLRPAAAPTSQPNNTRFRVWLEPGKPACSVYWGTHGCCLPPGHDGAHQCGTQPDTLCSQYDGRMVRHIYNGQWSQWRPAA